MNPGDEHPNPRGTAGATREVGPRAPRWIGRIASLLCVCSVLLVGALGAQEVEPLRVTASVGDGFIDDDTPIELTFDRAVRRPIERVAVFIDDTDVSDLFTRRARALRYDPRVLPLASGEHQMVVYQVVGGEWIEIGRAPLRVRTALGFDTSSTDPSATASWSTRVAKGFDPEANDPGEIPGNIDVRLGLTAEQTRGETRLASRASVVGTTEREYALRFDALGDDAPLFDLAEYAIQGASGPVELTVGHVSAGDQRHLIQGFGARGATLALHPGSRVDLSLGALHGNQVVGWGDLIGGMDADHRVLTGAVGVEALPEPGALRLEVTGMTGSILPRADVNQGQINDAEESRGAGVRLQARLLEGRVRIDGGFARSTFDNPADPTLAQGLDLVEVDEETHSARYLETSLDVLRGLRLGETRSARLTLGARHERVDPLYRSLGAYASADRQQNQVDAQADVAGVGVQANWATGRNNLDDVGSILTTRTRRAGATLRVPLGRVMERQSKWWPDLGASWDRTHQFGEGTPENGGFDPSHVPDQVSMNQSASAAWRFPVVGLSYRWNRSEQDNRQEGRADADFVGIRHAVAIQLTAWTRIQGGVDVGIEVAEDLGQDTRNETIRYGFNLNWRVFDRTALTLRFSDTTTEDDAETRGRGNSQINAQWTSFLPWMRRIEGQYFVRFARNVSDSFDSTFEFEDRREAWWIDLGLDFTFF